MSGRAVPVRTVVRIKGGEAEEDIFASGSKVALVVPEPGGPPTTRSFAVDRVLGPTVPTAQLFAEEVEPLCDRVAGGRHALVLAVGEKGSGKSFTLSGPGASAAISATVPVQAPPGIGQLSLRRIWAAAAAGRAHSTAAGTTGWLLALQHVAVYRERPYDLLTGRPQPAPPAALEAPRPGLILPALAAARCGSEEEALSAYSRSVGAMHTLAAELGVEAGALSAVCFVTLRQHLGADVVDVGAHGDRPSQALAHSGAGGGPGPDLDGAPDRSGQGGDNGDSELWSRLTVCRVGGWEALGEPLEELRLSQPHAAYASAVAVGRQLAQLADRGHRDAPPDTHSSALTRLVGPQLGGNAHLLILACVKPGSPAQSRTTLEYAARARQGFTYPLVNDRSTRANEAQWTAETAALRAEVGAIAATGVAAEGGALAGEEASRAALRQSDLEGQILRADMRAAALTAERDAARADAAARAAAVATCEEDRKQALVRLLKSEEESVRRGKALLDLKVEVEAELGAAEAKAADLAKRVQEAGAAAEAAGARAAELEGLHEAASAALEKARREQGDLEEDVVAYRTTLLSLREDAAAAEARVAELESELLRCIHSADAATAARDEARAASMSLAASLRAADAEVARASAAVGALREEVAAQRSRAATTAGRTSELEVAVAGADASLALARADAAKAHGALEEAKAARAAAAEDADTAREELAAARNDAADAANGRDAAEAALAAAHAERARVVEALEASRRREAAHADALGEARRRARANHDEYVGRLRSSVQQLGDAIERRAKAAAAGQGADESASLATGPPQAGVAGAGPEGPEPPAPLPPALRALGAHVQTLNALIIQSYAEREEGLERAARDAELRATELARELDQLHAAHHRLAEASGTRLRKPADGAGAAEVAHASGAGALAARARMGPGAEETAAADLKRSAEMRAAAAEASVRAMRRKLGEAEEAFRVAMAEAAEQVEAARREAESAQREPAPVPASFEEVAERSMAAQRDLSDHLAGLERARKGANDQEKETHALAQEVEALKTENAAMQAQLSARTPANAGEAVFRARQLELDLAAAEAERARHAARAAAAEEQLSQLQRYMAENMASYQKEILSLRRQVAVRNSIA